MQYVFKLITERLMVTDFEGEKIKNQVRSAKFPYEYKEGPSNPKKDLSVRSKEEQFKFALELLKMVPQEIKKEVKEEKKGSG